MTGDSFFGGDIFNTMFNNFFSGFAIPTRSFFPEFGRVIIPVMNLPRIELAVKKDEAAKEEATAEKTAVEKDEVMSRRREANLLRSQLSAAIESEEFEKAAELRDKIRELEIK
jgi:hypothetical protein